MKYYLITGLDEGIEIEPYVIDDKNEDLNYHLSCYGDSARYSQKITKERALELERLYNNKRIELCK